jgi:hypothetical protein
MISGKSRTIYITLSFSFAFFFLINILSAQDSSRGTVDFFPKRLTQRQDTSDGWKKHTVQTTEPDTNFTWEKYASFLNKISDTSKYTVLPLNEFRQTFNSRKIIIGLRHDVDNDLNVAYQFSEIEYKLGFRSTYFILHTAPYYLENPNNMAVHSEKILPILKIMQNKRHFEIGWHNDLVTLQVVYNINPVTFLHNELNWLRSNGINIVGTASHGSNYCKTYHYINYYFFEECTLPVQPNFNNNITVPVGGKSITLKKGNLKDFGLQYEAYFLNNNKYFSDAKVTEGVRWNIGMLDLSQLQQGDRVIILLHPIHWHKPSEHADIESFSMPRQLSCSVDTINSIISVIMPYGTDRRSLTAVYTLSPGAYAKVAGRTQVSEVTRNNFNSPVVYKVYAENRSVQNEWTVNVRYTKSRECDIRLFKIKGQTSPVNIDTAGKLVFVKGAEFADLKHVQVQVDISPGASAWIGKNKIIGNSLILNLSKRVEIRVLAEDGITSAFWDVTIQK